MEIEVNEENKDGNKRERKCSTPNSNPSSPPNKKFLTDTPKHEEDVKHVNDTEEKVKLFIDERTLKAKIVQLEEALEKVEKEHIETVEELNNKNGELKKLKNVRKSKK